MQMPNTQENLVLKHLENGTLTPMQSFHLYGITKLATVVSQLKRKGHQIQTVMVNGENRYGHHARFAEYHLIKGE